MDGRVVMTMKNEIACQIADALLARGAQGRGVPNVGTLGDLLRDYERAKVHESLEDSRGDEDDPTASETLDRVMDLLSYIPVGYRTSKEGA